MTRIAVAILNYNGEKLLRQFLPTVIQYSSTARVYVIDNGSTDGSIDALQQSFPEIEVIRLDANYGFCGGYNRGLQAIKAELYVLLNSDIEVTENWLVCLAEVFKNPMVAAAQPKILSWHNKNIFEYAGAGGGYIDSLGYPFCRGRVFNSVETDNGQYNDVRETFWASGACLMIRASVYQQFNGLDEDFFAHMEEIDLCWKINRTPMKVYYCGESTVYHVGAGTLSYNTPRKVYLNFKNGLTLIFKHLDTVEILYKLPIRVMLDWLAACLFAVQGNLNNSLSVLRAHRDFLWNFRSNLKKRRQVRRANRTYSRAKIYPGSVVFQYFVRRSKVIDVKNQ